MNTHKQVPNAQPQFINKVVADRVKVQRQVPQSKWKNGKRCVRIQLSDKMEDISCTTENTSSREFMKRSRFHSYSLHRKRCDPRLRTRRWKRLSMGGVLSVGLLSGLSTERPEPGASSAGFGRDDPPRSSRQWRCRRKPNTANVRRSCRVKETR